MKKNKAYTLIELMTTLMIMLALIIMSVLTLSSYMPKHRLLDSLETTEQTLSRAQAEAISRATWSCVKFTAATNMISVWMDTNGNRLCADAGELQITSQPIREGVSYSTTCAGSMTTFQAGRAIWFDSSGIPQTCSSLGACTGVADVQLILTNSQLPSGNMAREVEVVSSGLISIVPRNDKGFLPTAFAKSIDLPTGCETP